MTKIEDMSEPERQSWITVLADGGVFLYFMQKMTMGVSLRPVHTNISEFGSIILRVIILSVVLHVIIAIFFDLRKRKESFEKDERDIAIEGTGARWGYRILQFGLSAIAISIFMHNWIGEDYVPPLSIQSPVEIIYALMVVSYIASLVKHGRMLAAYRA